MGLFNEVWSKGIDVVQIFTKTGLVSTVNWKPGETEQKHGLIICN